MGCIRDIRVEMAEAWCKAIREYAQRLSRCNDRLVELRAQYDMLKAVRYDREGGSSMREHGDDAIFEYIDRIDEAVERVVQSGGDLMDESDEFERSLDRMPNQSYARVIRLRYVSCWDWSDIAREVPYTYNHLTTYVREAALDQLYDYMPERLKMPEACDWEIWCDT